MKKTDNRHYNNTKANRELRLTTEAWMKYGSEQVDFNCTHNGLPVKGKVIDCRYEGTRKNGTIYLTLNNGVADFPVPKPVIEVPRELLNEINDMRVMLHNKNQNAIGNYFIKDNFKKLLTDLMKLSLGEKVKRPLLHNLILQNNWQEIYPLINKLV